MNAGTQGGNDNNNGVGGFTSLISTRRGRSASLRRIGSSDYFQIPNTADQQFIGVRDIQRERTSSKFFLVHTTKPGISLRLRVAKSESLRL